MRTFLTIGLVATLLACGCDQRTEPPPAPAPIRVSYDDLGFPIKARPPCQADAVAAFSSGHPSEIARVASKGGIFTCGPAGSPLMLDEAVIDDSPVVVRALLEAGADPNARWCPFESRRRDPDLPWMGCWSEWGVTPVISAAARGDAVVTYVLLEAGADISRGMRPGETLLEIPMPEATFFLLLKAGFPMRGGAAAALKYLETHRPSDRFTEPSDETPLTAAICADLAQLARTCGPR